MKPAWLHRHFACPDCGLIVEIEDCPKPEGWGKPFIDGKAVPFDCSRCKAHYNFEEFMKLNEDKWSQDAELPEEQP